MIHSTYLADVSPIATYVLVLWFGYHNSKEKYGQPLLPKIFLSYKRNSNLSNRTNEGSARSHFLADKETSDSGCHFLSFRMRS